MTSTQSDRNAAVPDGSKGLEDAAPSPSKAQPAGQHLSKRTTKGSLPTTQPGFNPAETQPSSALTAKAPTALTKMRSGTSHPDKDAVKVSLARHSRSSWQVQDSTEPSGVDGREEDGDDEDDEGGDDEDEDLEDGNFAEPKGRTKRKAPAAMAQADRRRDRQPAAALAPRRSTRAGADTTKLRLKALAAASASTGSDASEDSSDHSGSDSGSSEDNEPSSPAGAARKRRAVAVAPDRRGLRERVQASVRHAAPRKRPSRSSGDEDEDSPSSASSSDDDQEESEEEEAGARGRRVPLIRPSGKARAATAEERAAARAEAELGARVQAVLERDGQRFLCKLHGSSYRKLQWVARSVLEAHRPRALQSYLKQMQSGEPPENADEWRVAERVAAQRRAAAVAGAPKVPVSQQPLEYLVKWQGLDYQHSTWEPAQELLASDTDKVLVTRFNGWIAKRPKAVPTLHKLRAKLRATPATRPAPGAGAASDEGPLPSSRTDLGQGSGLARADGGVAEGQLDASFAMPVFLNNRSLRDYQEKSVRWMVNNFAHLHNSQLEPINCILGDEMGLGKTAQSISALEVLRRVGGIPGPFLVVAPLTTLGHWQREIQTWTDMNVVLYTGDAEDRALIQEHELMNPDHPNQCKFDVLLCAYDMLRRDQHTFKRFAWQAAILDEAHKLKSVKSSTRAVVTELDIQWKLLLTGTPIQNDMSELYSMMNLLAPRDYRNADTFHDTFGGGKTQPTVAQIQKLQDALRPILLRRMKEDVENLPEKEEVIIWITMTNEQRAYYKALYAGQIAALLGGGSTKNANLPGMRNLGMELRKLCCHPFLCCGLEEDIMTRWEAAGLEGQQCSQAAMMERASGKMMLLGKLLPRLREEGKKVLIFSQFKIMLNVIEDYLGHKDYPCERIDGDTKGRERQKAIDRFMEVDDEGFVFLLSTRAGGQGITLTSADTIIIYDSDWNPQNDLQAMARCHRIGQDKEVKVYRLITKDSYEERIFDIASKKYGLDEAILGFSAGDDPELDAGRIANLLKNGAHCLADTGADAAADAFAAEGIDQVLAGRSEKRQIGNKAGNTFSTARFAVGEEDAPDGQAPTLPGAPGNKKKGVSDRALWESLLPDAVKAYEEKLNVPLGARKRGPVNYSCGGDGQRAGVSPVVKATRYNQPEPDSDFSGNPDSDDDDGDDDEDEDNEGASMEGSARTGAGRVKGAKVRLPRAAVPIRWTFVSLVAVFDRYISLGGGQCWERLHREVVLQPVRSLGEVKQLCLILGQITQVVADLGDAQLKAAGVTTAAAIESYLRTRQARQARLLVAEQLEAIVEGMQVPRQLTTCLLGSKTREHVARGAHTMRASMAECRALHALLDKADAASEGQAAPSATRGLVPLLPQQGVPNWWTSQHDEDLLVGAGRHGYHHPWGAKAAVHLTLSDPTLSFEALVQLQPLTHTAAAAAAAAACDPAGADVTAPHTVQPVAAGAAAAAHAAAAAAAAAARVRAVPGTAYPPAPPSSSAAAAALGAFTFHDLRKQHSGHCVPRQLLEAVHGDKRLAPDDAHVDVDYRTLVLDHVLDTSDGTEAWAEPMVLVKFAGYAASWRKAAVVSLCPTYSTALAAHQVRCAVIARLLAAPRPPPLSAAEPAETAAVRAAASACAAAAAVKVAAAASKAAAAAAAATGKQLLDPSAWSFLVSQASQRMRRVVLAALDANHDTTTREPLAALLATQRAGQVGTTGNGCTGEKVKAPASGSTDCALLPPAASSKRPPPALPAAHRVVPKAKKAKVAAPGSAAAAGTAASSQ